MARGSSGRMGDRWYAWWRGDQIEADFAKQVSRALRALAYETMVKAKERIVRRQFADDAVIAPDYYGQLMSEDLTKRGRRYKQRRIRIVKTLKRWRFYVPSQPGESPTNQTGYLRASIRYAFRDEGRGLLESFSGPVLGIRKKGDSKVVKTFSESPVKALEWGGYSVNRGGKRVYIKARPFMRPAGYEVLKSGLLRRTLENSLGRNLQGPPNPAIGWLGT